MGSDPPVLFSAREAAAVLDIGVRTVHRWVEIGRMRPAKQVGKTFVFTGDEIARVARAPRPRMGRPPIARNQPDELPLRADAGAPP